MRKAVGGSKAAKRLFDIVFAAMTLVLTLPLFLGIASWIRLDSAGPVFFRQLRVGYRGIPFLIRKFRTMEENAEQQGQLTVGSDSRVTRVGRFLRKYKLDELPQLIDVLVGNMSLVGPRPEVPHYVDYYPSTVRDKVLSVKPGMTDWASIHMFDENEKLGRCAHPEQTYIEQVLPEKLDYYVRYVETHTVLGDIKIIATTLAKIVARCY